MASDRRHEMTGRSLPNVTQIGLLLQAAKTNDPELGCFLHVAVSTGARRGELCALRWRDLNSRIHTLFIDGSKIDSPGEISDTSTKTLDTRHITLDAPTLQAFDEQRNRAIDRSKQANVALTEDSYVFSPAPDGLVPWNPYIISKRFEKLQHSLGYDGITLHDLRHYCI
ncbi:MAG: tyrosine-type recombinase/integrase [Acidimicrobiales bacterium]